MADVERRITKKMECSKTTKAGENCGEKRVTKKPKTGRRNALQRKVETYSAGDMAPIRVKMAENLE